MRAAIVREFGPISSHCVGELPRSKSGPGEVLVKIKAAAVNYVDSLVVTGKYQFLPERPFAPGKLPVGEISGLGPGVTEFKIGDRVLTLAEQGGYAEQVSVDAKQCFKLPTSMSFIDAASMALVYDTSWFALHERARLHKGESVLVLGRYRWRRPRRDTARQGDGRQGAGGRIQCRQGSRRSQSRLGRHHRFVAGEFA